VRLQRLITARQFERALTFGSAGVTAAAGVGHRTGSAGEQFNSETLDRAKSRPKENAAHQDDPCACKDCEDHETWTSQSSPREIADSRERFADALAGGLESAGVGHRTTP